MNSNQDKWTEIEHLPEWDEEFYEVYTAKKYGKWVMLKTLRPELRDREEYRDMIEKEFDVRYNLAPPNIIMINDVEEVRGLGRCIITDDVYGDSLRKLLDRKEVTPEIKQKIVTSLVDALRYIQTNHIVHHPLRPETIIFTENIRNLKMIDVGFDQKQNLTSEDASADVYNFGKVLTEVLDATGEPSGHLRRIAERCTNPDPSRRYRDANELRMAIDGNSNRRLYMVIIAFLAVMTVLLGWLCIKHPAL